MKMSKLFRDALIQELDFVLAKMKDSPTLENKLYFFSAIPAEVQRILNLEFSLELVYVHNILQNTYQAFMQRHSAARAGDPIRILDEQIAALEAYTAELQERIEMGIGLDDLMKKFVYLTFSTTGNGHYLLQKGLLKV